MDTVKVEQRVGVVVDVLNLFYAAKNIHRAKVDYAKLLRTLVENNTCVRAVAYVIRKPDTEQSGFVSALQHIGYEVKVRELRRHIDKEGNSSPDRSSWNVGMAVDALAMAPRLDTLMLVSGNSDFVPLVVAVQQAGCKVVAAGIQGSLSSELIKASDSHRVLGEECMFRDESMRDAVAKLPARAGATYMVNGDEVDDLSDIDEVVPPSKGEQDGGGFGFLGSTASESVDKAGLPKE